MRHSTHLSDSSYEHPAHALASSKTASLSHWMMDRSAQRLDIGMRHVDVRSSNSKAPGTTSEQTDNYKVWYY